MQTDSPPIVRLNRSRPPLPQTHVGSSRPIRMVRRDTNSTPTPVTSALSAPTQANDLSTVRTDAEMFLRQAGHASLISDGRPDGLSRAGLNVRKASDRQHLQAIAQAYAFYVQLCANPNRASLVTELEAMSGCKRTRTTTDLHLVVERFVSYGGDTPAERLAARKLVSRDVRAIAHLEATRVLPSRVQALGATTGDGLHAWARRAASDRSAKPKLSKQTTTQTRSEQRQRALIYEITITTRRPDGTRKRRTKLRVTGILTMDLAAVRQRLKRLTDPKCKEGTTP